MASMRRVSLLALALSTALLAAAPDNTTWARGGGGRGGGFGGRSFGGFDRGYDGGRGYGGDGLDRGDEWGHADWGRADASFARDLSNQGISSRDAFATPHVSDAQLRAGADQSYNWSSGARGASQADRSYNWGGDQHTLATDGGFARLASAGGTNGPTYRSSPAELAREANAVRQDYGYQGVFNRDFWRRNNDYWPYGWDDWGWGDCGWSDLAGWWGMPEDNPPTDYDYGNNITYQGDSVYYGSQNAGSAESYYNEAQTLAASAPVTAVNPSNLQKRDWKPLGVFSLVQGGQKNTTTMFQLAVNKKGAIRGTYYNPLTQEVKPVTGAVDKKRGRAAWIVGGDKTVVYDTGLANLLKQQSPLLVHYGKDKTQQWTLVKLKQPKKS